MKKIAAVVSLVAFGTAVSAQTATTNCMAMGSMVNCNTVGGGDDHSLEILSNVIHNASEASVKSKIGRMIAAGQCEEARDYALKKGRLEMASSVERLCSSQTGPNRAAAASLPPPSQVARQAPAAEAPQPRSQSDEGGWPGLTPYQVGRLIGAIQMQKTQEQISGARDQ